MEDSSTHSEDVEQRPRRRHRGFSTNDKYNAILRHLRGDSRTEIAEEIGISVERLTRWEATFIKAGLAALESSSHSAIEERAKEKRRNTLLTLAVLGLIALIGGSLVLFLRFY